MAGERQHDQLASSSLPPFDARVAFAVVVGGGIGSLTRAEVSTAWSHGAGQWPWATFVANLVGAALLGALVVRTSHRPHLHGLLGTGLCGGLTTFSTLQLEAVQLLDDGHAGMAAGYLTASIAAGLALASGAAWLARPRGSQA
jgi:fluoride exporter